MHRFVNPGQSLTLGRNRREFIELDKNNIDVETFDNAKRQIPGTKAGVAKETFRDLRCTLTESRSRQSKSAASAAELRLWMRISVSAVESVRRSVSLMRSI